MAIPERWQQRFYRIVQVRYVVWLLLFVLCFIAWNRGLALLYGIVAMLLATFTLSAIVPWIYLARVRARFLTIAPVHAGSDQTIELKLQALKSVYGITLQLPQEAAEEDGHSLRAHISGLQPKAKTEHIAYQVPTTQRGRLSCLAAARVAHLEISKPISENDASGFSATSCRR